MIRKLIVTALIAAVWQMAFGLSLAAQVDATTANRGAKAEIRRQVGNYLQSIDDADTKLGATVWSPTPDVTFIEPLGHEHGWDEIASVVYGKLMGQTFTKRTLKPVSDVSFTCMARRPWSSSTGTLWPPCARTGPRCTPPGARARCM